MESLVIPDVIAEDIVGDGLEQLQPENAAKPRQLRSRIAQDLNVPTTYASAFRSLRPRWTSFSSILLALNSSNMRRIDL